jgi:hypothetical protein
MDTIRFYSFTKLGFSVIFLIYILCRCTLKKEDKWQDLAKDIEKQNLVEQSFIYRSWESYINRDIQVWDSEYKLLKISNLFKDKDVLIFRIPNIDCSPCIDQDVSFFNKNSKNLVYFISSKNFRHYLAFCEKYPNKKCYLIPERGLSLKLEELGKPYLFFLKKGTLKPVCYFFPKKELPKFSLQYIEIMNGNIDK